VRLREAESRRLLLRLLLLRRLAQRGRRRER
jgi:hypothetical protein